ncbi:hypothetical protein Pfo_027111 [Paulownia fortunei]|nr:hypothetical protein Pfo_027111 [Paulownia fortunei]
MEDLFGQIECRSKSDSIVMRILRSAMDNAHEKLQSKDGPIEFLHQRSTFYELAAILVEGGLNIVQGEDIVEDNCNKILSDLMEIRHWLQGRIQDMKQLIVEKDRELTERLENETKLQQALELKDRELVYLHEKLEPGQMKNEDIHDLPIGNQAIQDGATEGDIFKLKNSVDQQVSNIKQKLEDEKKILTTERRTRKSRVSSPNLSFEFLDKEINGSSVFKEDNSFGIDRFPNIKHQSELSRPNQNVLIRGMSSDIDILKETLDLAFGRMQSAEVLPLEKQWRWTIEKDIESILVKGFISDLQGSFDVELKKKVGLLKDNWFHFIDEMRALCHEMKDFFTRNDVHEKGSSMQGSSNPFPTVRRTTSEPLPDIQRTTSEPLPDISYMQNLLEEATEVDGSHYVAKMIKNHESIIRKQREEWNLLTREVLQREGFSSWNKGDNDNNRLERRIQDAVTRLDNFSKRNHKLADQTGVSDRNLIQEKRRIPKSDIKTYRSSTTVESLEIEIEKLKEERDGLRFQISVMEDTYQLLFRGMMKDVSIELCCEDTERLMKNDSGGLSPNKFSQDHINSGKKRDRAVDELGSSTSTQILLHYLESTIREDLYVVFFWETVKQWKNFAEECIVKEKRSQIACDDPTKCIPSNQSHMLRGPEIPSDDFPFNSILRESIGSLLKEDIYMVFFREMAEAWKSEKDSCAIESLIREDIYQFVIIEAVKDSHVHLMESEALKQLDFEERTPRSRKLKADNIQEGTPHSRKLETDGEESLIQKLDSLLKCLEAEEDLMLRASSEIKEHSVNNSLVILNCEEMDERNAIEWLITDDESTFSSVSEKLERALQQLYTSKELLVELEQSLEVSDDLGENYHQVQFNNILSIEHGKTDSFLKQEDDQVSQAVPSDNVLAIIMQFQQVIGNVEHMLHENLERKCLRLELLKHQLGTLTEPVALIRTRKLLYKKAFISRCHNLKLAETEVDLLGDQVESLLCLLERIYVELNQNATVLSGYFEVYDILKLIKTELNNGRSCKPKS